MILVHHLNNSRSQRVLWLLEELGVEYELKLYQRNPETLLAPPELLAVHPLGKSPVISDGETTLAESGAILEYLVDRYGQGRLRPSGGTPDRVRYLYWMHYAEGSAMPPLLLKLIFDRIETGAPLLVRPVARGISAKVKARVITPQLARHLSFMEAELGRSTWFAGTEFSAADIQLSFPVEAAKQRAGLTPTTHPRLSAYLERIHARPAYQRALERGGPYNVGEA